jgi:hypothetical protein
MRNLLWTTLRNSGALLACSVLQCNSRHGSDSDNNVRSQQMGQVIVTLHS